MPQVNWEVFEQLPGSAEKNFEMLCRLLIRRHYAKFGDFRALAAQPGVEFHLTLQTHCALGDPGRRYGWQCRWYDLPSGRALGTARREKIAKAIALTERVLPDLTDWVLWTRRPLTKGDQNWFYALKTRFQCHLWTASEVEEHLSGDAEILRSTYFGELVLTPETLVNLHRVAVAPVRRKWQPEVHQTIAAERKLRRMLAEPGTWDDVRDFAQLLEAEAAAAYRDLKNFDGPVASAAADVAAIARSLAVALTEGYIALEKGDLDLLRQQLSACPRLDIQKLALVPRRLRAIRHKAALTVTNALADIRRGCKILDEIGTSLNTRLVSVAADAGCGKTELAAQLTSAAGNRPAGILLHGRHLQAGHNLDYLARSVTIHGGPAASMEALIAAVDAAGQRAHRRLPIVIDGLNEAEDPRDWKSQLASLTETLLLYPYVLVVCTVRKAFVGEALPDEVRRLQIPHFEHDTSQAVRQYFKYYRIDAADADLPWGLLRHPLSLRLFCEVTNPNRQNTVGVEAMPGSLTAVFDLYLEQASERIAELAPRTRRFYAQDVRIALDEIGWTLWEQRARSLEFAALRHHLGDERRSWDESIIRALEQDGILLRVRDYESTSDHVAVLFDALAGHLIANAVLTKHGRTGVEAWLQEPATIRSLSGSLQERHPLASDTSRALVGLFPRRLHREQLWSHVQEPLRSVALLDAADLEGTYLDAVTVSELAGMMAQPPSGSGDLLDRLRHTRSAPSHPLNTEFLDSALRPMSVAQRDLRWTEWVRKHTDDVLIDLQRLEKKWHNLAERSRSDRLRARWTMWILTSTVRKIRDQATRTLYWFGRGQPAALFDLTLSALDINDDYVLQRLLGASYGVALAHQRSDGDFENVFGEFLSGLRDALTGTGATHPTNDWLARLYVQGCVSLASACHRGAVPKRMVRDNRVAFALGPAVDPIPTDDPRAPNVNRALTFYFDDDTLSRLISDWHNSRIKHEFRDAIVAHLRGTLSAFGWSESGLGALDKSLVQHNYGRDREPSGQYGKKYAWIGYYTCPGILDVQEKGSDGERPSDVQIDPSFPEPVPPAPINVPMWARPTPADDRRWVRNGIVGIPDALFYCPRIGSHAGPWVAVQGHLRCETKVPNRGVFGLLTAVLVDAKEADRLVNALSTRDYPGDHWIPQVPSDYYTFAGEIPWSPEFARGHDSDLQAESHPEVIRTDESVRIDTEILAYEYAWESYHSPLNQAGGALVPSRSFSSEFKLQGVPQSFNQTLPDGTTASISLSAPSGFSGRLLYLREDLVQQYANGRRLVWFMWGERQLYDYIHSPPDWLVKAHRSYAHVWRRVCRGEELSPILGRKIRHRSTRRSPRD
jgi:hypothetical protein